jgi:hypothetical protein
MGAQPIPKTLHFHYRTTQWINFRKVAVLNTMCMLILTKPKLLNMVYHNFSADSFIFEVIEMRRKLGKGPKLWGIWRTNFYCKCKMS